MRNAGEHFKMAFGMLQFYTVVPGAGSNKDVTGGNGHAFSSCAASQVISQ
jgi:hypothetical protein